MRDISDHRCYKKTDSLVQQRRFSVDGDNPVSEKLCEERVGNLTRIVEEVKDEVLKIRILWTGNGKIGAGHQVRTLWDVHVQEKKSTQGWIDWAFRLAIVLMLGWLRLK